METGGSTEQRFRIGCKNTGLFSILIFVLGFVVLSAMVHRAYGINDAPAEKSVSQPVPNKQPTPQTMSVQGHGEDVTKSGQKTAEPMSLLKVFLLIGTTLLTGFTYPMICVVYFKTLTRRKNEIIELLKDKTIDQHLKLFGTRSPQDLFNLYHNWKDYILPVALNMIVVMFASVALIVKTSGLQPPPPFSIVDNLPYVVLVGFFGAYIFSHYDMIRRISSMDLTPTLMYKLWLKLLVGAILGYLVTSIITPHELKLITAFGLGIIPFDELSALIGRVASKSLNLSVENVVADQPNLHKLQGLTVDVIDRLQEEGIVTTQHLAFANPILLLLKTNIEWTAILDMINQAVLYIFIGDKIEQLRTIGIRSATDIIKITRLKINEEGNKPKNGEKLIELISTKLGQDTIGAYNLIGNVANNPQVNLICDLLEGTCEGGSGFKRP